LKKGRRHFFFEKKKQKTITYLMCAAGERLGFNGEKFFASFFQKRSAFFPSF
jgi:hypothetical protein